MAKSSKSSDAMESMMALSLSNAGVAGGAAAGGARHALQTGIAAQPALSKTGAGAGLKLKYWLLLVRLRLPLP